MAPLMGTVTVVGGSFIHGKCNTQEVDNEGLTLEERVENAMEEIQDRLRQLEKMDKEEVRYISMDNGKLLHYVHIL